MNNIKFNTILLNQTIYRFILLVGLTFTLFYNCSSGPKKEDLIKELESSKGTIESLNKELEDAKQKESALQNEIEKYKQAEVALKRDLKNSQDDDKIKKELSFCNKTLESLENDLAQAKKTVTEHEDKISYYQKRELKIKRIFTKLRNQNKSLKSELASSSKEAKQRQIETEKRMAEYKELLSKFRSLMDSGSLKIKMVDGRIHVVLPSDILFRSGQATLNKNAIQNISEITKVLVDIPDKKYQIEGHTDNIPISTINIPSNWELASFRAINVVKAMILAGMPPDRISAASFGEYKPNSPNDTKEGRILNRRIDIVILPDLSSLPGYREISSMEKK